MELDRVKRSIIVMGGPDLVERMRRALNAAYSEVPPELDGVFSAALDQIADQQVQVSQALTLLISTDTLPEAERRIEAATREAQRAALRAARAYADRESDEATMVHQELTRIPLNVTDLVGEKRKLDAQFAQAVQWHEQDNIEALELLLNVASSFQKWSVQGQLAISGAVGLVEADRRRQRLQYWGIAVAILLGVINIVLNIVQR